MASSSELQRYKTLYYERNLPAVSIQNENTEVTVKFKNGDSKISVTGSSEDFVNAVSRLVPTVREGISQFIELSETSSKSKKEYQTKVDKFKSKSEHPVNEATQRLQDGEVAISDDLDWRKALEASFDGDLGNPHLSEVINKYYESVALLRSDMLKLMRELKKIRKRKPYDPFRFDKFESQADAILEYYYLSEPPYRAYKSFRENCITDTEYFAKRIARNQENRRAFWLGLGERELDVNDEMKIAFENMENSDEAGAVEADIGIEKILKQYENLYEIVREPLRDIAVTLNGGDSNFAGQTNILKFLDNNEAQTFTEAIEKQMRHGPAHNQIEIDKEEAKVKFYNGRGRDRILLKTINFTDILGKYYELSDLRYALLKSINLMEYRIGYQYLSSDDFRYRIIEKL